MVVIGSKTQEGDSLAMGMGSGPTMPRMVSLDVTLSSCCSEVVGLDVFVGTRVVDLAIRTFTIDAHTSLVISEVVGKTKFWRSPTGEGLVATSLQ